MNLPMSRSFVKRTALLFALALFLLSQLPQSAGAADLRSDANLLALTRVIYDNQLASGWQNWSWDVTVNLSASSPVHSAPQSIAVTQTGAWGAFSLHHENMPTGGYTHLRFWVHGGAAGGQRIWVIANEDGPHRYELMAPAGSWQEVSIPLSSLGSPANLHRLHFQGASDSVLAAFYVDDLVLVNPTAGDITPRVWVPLLRLPGFTLLPPGSGLPSDAACAARVQKRPENKGVNREANATRGSQSLPDDFFGSAVDPRANTVIAKRVTGNFTGTTDEILQWAACKWGIDENMVRAQAAKESWWRQDTLGDWTTDENRCAPGRGFGVDGRPGQCPESFGLLQTRYPYMHDAWPSMENSTAFNADLAYAIWRSCYEGYEWWLNDVERGWDYAAGDAYGCMGRWFSGRWHTQAAEDYITAVREYYDSRIWETPSFQEP